MIKNARQELEKPDTPLPVWIGGLLAKGSTMILGGQAKLGKTAIIMEFGDALTTARNLFLDPRFPITKPATVHIFDQELGDWGFEERLRDRFTRQGKVPSKNLWFSSKVSDIFLDGLGWKKLVSLLKQTDADIVLLDPASYFITEGTNTKIRDLFSNLWKVREELGKPELSVVLAHHAGKPPKGRDAVGFDQLDPYNFRDGSNWVNDSDAMMTLGYKIKTPHDPKTLWTLKGRLTLRNFAEPEDFKLAVNRDWTVTTVEEKRKNPILTSLGNP